MDLSLMEKFANPEYIDSLTMGEKMAGAGITTLLGLGTTFVILCLIWLILSIMGKVMTAGKAKKAAPAAEAVTTAPAAAPAAAPAENLAGDAQLVAVITAAIAAYEGSQSANSLVVRNITRVTGAGSAWSHAGSMDCLESRNMIDKRH
ncbi:MAG: OadG family protein [Firmicutes bacterium]|nr:OadG family protein [Bacillota bacterium]